MIQQKMAPRLSILILISRNKILFFCSVLILFNVSCMSSAFSEDKISGEIININYKYGIAFSDLSSYQLNVGEIVQVYQEGMLISDLKVAEVSSAISKLVPLKTEVGSREMEKFKQIEVGDTVIKQKGSNRLVEQPLLKVESGTKNSVFSSVENDLNEAYLILKEKYGDLSVSIAEMVNEKRFLETELKESQERMKEAQSHMDQMTKRYSQQDEELQKYKYLERTQGNTKDKQKIRALEDIIFKLKSQLEHMNQLIKREEK